MNEPLTGGDNIRIIHRTAFISDDLQRLIHGQGAGGKLLMFRLIQVCGGHMAVFFDTVGNKVFCYRGFISEEKIKEKPAKMGIVSGS